MVDGKRLASRMQKIGLSQSELARRVGVAQQTIYKLIKGGSRSSTYLHLIARELETTPYYLTGETDDPDENAPPPPPKPSVQQIMMSVTLPSEAALSAMFEGQLLAFHRLEGAELARALAKRLPKALARLQVAELYEEMVDDADDPPADQARPEGRPVRRRAQHK